MSFPAAGGWEASLGLLRALWRTSSLPCGPGPEKDPHSGPPVHCLEGSDIQIPPSERPVSPHTMIGCGSPWSFRRRAQVFLADRRAQINMERRCVQGTTTIDLG